MRVMSVVGARPQFVKLAPLSRELRLRHEEVIVHTGQHYGAGMSDSFFEELEIPSPDVHLNIGSGPHGAQTGAMLAALEATLVERRPDLVIVFGDTNSTLAAALAAAKLCIPVVHVEAGLRSFNRSMPEEINRVVVDHASDHLFAPTLTALANLQRERLGERTWLTGDIMVDALEHNRQRAMEVSRVCERLGLQPQGYLLLTLHRPYNVDEPSYLQSVLTSVSAIGLPVVMSVHPRTRAVIEQHSLDMPRNLIALPPQRYLDFLRLQADAYRVVTDSGGVQKEAYLLGVPCITLRPETEWTETVQSGWNLLADPNNPSFLDEVRGFAPSGVRPPVFGTRVARRMVMRLECLETTGRGSTLNREDTASPMTERAHAGLIQPSATLFPDLMPEARAG